MNCNGKLDKGETWTYSLTTTAPVQNAGTTHTNTATATGTDDEGNSTSARAHATTTYTEATPSISISKSAAPTSVSEGGVGSQSVTYTYTVQNTSQASTDPLSVVVTDSDGTPVYQSGHRTPNTTLFPYTTLFRSLTTTAPVQNAGTTHTNTATATGSDDEGNS